MRSSLRETATSQNPNQPQQQSPQQPSQQERQGQNRKLFLVILKLPITVCYLNGEVSVFALLMVQILGLKTQIWSYNFSVSNDF